MLANQLLTFLIVSKITQINCIYVHVRLGVAMHIIIAMLYPYRLQKFAIFNEILFSTTLFRWTVKADTLQSVLDNYASLITLWDEILEVDIDSDVRAKVLGIKSQMENFRFLFGKQRYL